MLFVPFQLNLNTAKLYRSLRNRDFKQARQRLNQPSDVDVTNNHTTGAVWQPRYHNLSLI